jgi:PTS system nitrogen regulatory IIA component
MRRPSAACAGLTPGRADQYIDACTERMRRHHCFQAGSVVSDLRSTDKFEALRELIRRAPVFSRLAVLAEFQEAVIARERQQSTGFGHGVAVAHGRVIGVPRVLIALGVSKAGIDFDSPDSAPVRLLAVIASPPHLSLDYLQALSTLVRCLRDQDDRDALLHAASAREIESRIRAAFTAALERFEEPLRRGSPG